MISYEIDSDEQSIPETINFKLLSSIANDELFEEYPDADWYYEALSLNKNISEEIVIKYAYKPWNLIKLSTKNSMTHRFDKYDKKIKKQIKNCNNSKNNFIVFK